jgi:hypothetical protein
VAAGNVLAAFVQGKREEDAWLIVPRSSFLPVGNLEICHHVERGGDGSGDVLLSIPPDRRAPRRPNRAIHISPVYIFTSSTMHAQAAEFRLMFIAGNPRRCP